MDPHDIASIKTQCHAEVAKAHYCWMEEVNFEQPIQYLVMQEHVDCVLALSKHFKAFDEHIPKAAGESVSGR
jgi:hypothetical protein